MGGYTLLKTFDPQTHEVELIPAPPVYVGLAESVEVLPDGRVRVALRLYDNRLLTFDLPASFPLGIGVLTFGDFDGAIGVYYTGIHHLDPAYLQPGDFLGVDPTGQVLILAH
jgi:hypothetical protein